MSLNPFFLDPPFLALDPWKLVMDASAVVKGVMLVLVIFSLLSWFVVGMKWLQIQSAKSSSTEFLKLFWAEDTDWTVQSMEGLFAKSAAHLRSPVANIFRAGYAELAKLSSAKKPSLTANHESNIERALRSQLVGELDRMESFLSVLATIGSVGPFIGLFGTVWGIMNSFLAIDAKKGASLAVVAPGIAEALIATAIGLVAAIPAVMFYNYLIRKIKLLEVESEHFAYDFLNIVKRNFLT